MTHTTGNPTKAPQEGRIARIITFILLGVITFSFVFVGTGDMLMKPFKDKPLATIDDKPIDTAKFLEFYAQRVQSIKAMHPGVTTQDLMMAGIPERLLHVFVNDLVILEEIKEQRFRIADSTLEEHLTDHAKDIARHLETHHINKKTFIENVRNDMLRRQVVLSYDLPVGYKQLLHESFHIKRKFDLIHIEYSKIPIQKKPTPLELEVIAKDNTHKLMAPEMRSFQLLVFTPQSLKVSPQAVESYFTQHKDEFKDKKHKKTALSSVKAQIIQKLQTQTNLENLEIIKKRLDKEDITLESLAKEYGYSVQTLENISRLSTHTNSTLVNVAHPEIITEEVFNLQTNGTSDIIEDTSHQRHFMVHVTKATPAQRMTGDDLQKALHNLWVAKEQNAAGQRHLEQLLQLESQPKELDAYIKKYLVTPTSFMLSSVDTHPDIPFDLKDRVLATPLGRITFVNTPIGILVARIREDIPFRFDPKTFEKESDAMTHEGMQSVEHAFLLVAQSRHKIAFFPKQLRHYVSQYQ